MAGPKGLAMLFKGAPDSEEDDGADLGSSAKADAARELRMALKGDDDEALASAFQSMVDACGGDYEDDDEDMMEE